MVMRSRFERNWQGERLIVKGERQLHASEHGCSMCPCKMRAIKGKSIWLLVQDTGAFAPNARDYQSQRLGGVVWL